MNKNIVTALFIICAVGLTAASVTLVKIYNLNDEMSKFTPLSLNKGLDEVNSAILIAKIESLESVLMAQGSIYQNVIDQNVITLIIICILFNLAFLLLLFTCFFRKK